MMLTDARLNEFAIALHEKHTRPAGGIEYSHALLKRLSAVERIQDEVCQRHWRVVCAAFPPFGAPGGIFGSMQELLIYCLLYTSPSPRDRQKSRMPSSA